MIKRNSFFIFVVINENNTQDPEAHSSLACLAKRLVTRAGGELHLRVLCFNVETLFSIITVLFCPGCSDQRWLVGSAHCSCITLVGLLYFMSRDDARAANREGDAALFFLILRDSILCVSSYAGGWVYFVFVLNGASNEETKVHPKLQLCFPHLFYLFYFELLRFFHQARSSPRKVLRRVHEHC